MSTRDSYLRRLGHAADRSSILTQHVELLAGLIDRSRPVRSNGTAIRRDHSGVSAGSRLGPKGATGDAGACTSSDNLSDARRFSVEVAAAAKRLACCGFLVANWSDLPMRDISPGELSRMTDALEHCCQLSEAIAFEAADPRRIELLELAAAQIEWLLDSKSIPCRKLGELLLHQVRQLCTTSVVSR